uniref:Plasminogen n=1 Tax=Callorhinchus milii TaxID=7868 RepID=A0A4W3H005_CALMI
MELHPAVPLPHPLRCLLQDLSQDPPLSDLHSEYDKTEGAWIYSTIKSTYVQLSVEECAAKCSRETTFICRAFLFTQKENECLITADNSKTTQLLRRTNTVLYEKKDFLLECRRGSGFTYRGTKSQTVSGITCQKWSSSTPHVPRYKPNNFPYAGLEANFCRNPDNDTGGPWCYTQDPKKRWEYCRLPECEDTCMYCSGENYRGQVSQTEDGVKCQAWNSQVPHRHGYNPSFFADKYLQENYCRNPDGEPRPWCFTTALDRRWAFCNIKRCSGEPPSIEIETKCYTERGQLYRGNISTTRSGKTCQHWDSKDPHVHSRTHRNYPCRGLESNYCRNPDSEKEPWCYTTDASTRWEYCQVPKCGNQTRDSPPECYNGTGVDYRGTVSMTISGKRCQAWESMKPHRHLKTPKNFPNSGLEDNLCRNPDRDRAPWCFTTDPSTRWEFCNIKKCLSVVILPSRPPPSNRPSVAPEKECIIGNGVTYRGSRSITSSGRTCQEWSSMTPHIHVTFTPEVNPNKGLEGNHCRNPDNDANGPWCYTTDREKKYDYCDDIPQCELSTKCGKPAIEPKNCYGRIVGGCVSNPYSWPWQVSVRTGYGFHFCGGTLIAPKWVLTARHCLKRSTRPSAYRIYLGIYKEDSDERSKQIRDVDKLVMGPDNSDIALVRLSRPAILNDKVSVVCLPEKDYIVPSGTGCFVTGWGETQGTGGDKYLKETGFPVFDNKICNRPEFLNGVVTSKELCAGDIDGGHDTCQGDSGGPLVCPDSSKRYVLQGVTSWGYGCARRMKPGIYVRVSSFIDWIESTIS